jgi:hypothetical protein
MSNVVEAPTQTIRTVPFGFGTTTSRRPRKPSEFVAISMSRPSIRTFGRSAGPGPFAFEGAYMGVPARDQLPYTILSRSRHPPSSTSTTATQAIAEKTSFRRRERRGRALASVFPVASGAGLDMPGVYFASTIGDSCNRGQPFSEASLLLDAHSAALGSRPRRPRPGPVFGTSIATSLASRLRHSHPSRALAAQRPFRRASRIRPDRDILSAVIPLSPGAVLDGYEIVGLLGRGGMGAVYRARRPGQGEVALKTLVGEVTEEEAARFRREAEVLGALEHPSIVPIRGAGEAMGLLYFAMGLVEGESLDAKIRREGALDPEEAVRIVLEIADAVAYAHDRKVIHRDLKPANVLLDEHVHPLVTDFGLARRTDEAQRLTRTGEIMGTPAYMAPEQAFGRSKELDERTDVYGLGAILYATLAGRQPFHGATAFETIKLVRDREPEPIGGRVSPALEEFVVARALAKRPEDRPPTARDFARELSSAFLARPPLPRGLLLGLLAVALVCAAGTVGLVLWKVKRQHHDTAQESPVDRARREGRLEELQRLGRTASDPRERTKAFLAAGDVAFEQSAWAAARAAYEEVLKDPKAGLDRAANARFVAAHVLEAQTYRDGLAKLLRPYPAEERGQLAYALACAHLYDLALAQPGAKSIEGLATLRAEEVPPAPDQRAHVARTWLADAGRRSTVWIDRCEAKFKAVYLKGPDADKDNAGRTVALDLVHEVEPIIADYANAHELDPSIGLFPAELAPIFGWIRYVGGLELQRPPFVEAWDQAFARAPHHPTLVYIHALDAVETPGRSAAALGLCDEALPELLGCEPSLPVRLLAGDFVSCVLVPIALSGEGTEARKRAEPLAKLADIDEASTGATHVAELAAPLTPEQLWGKAQAPCVVETNRFFGELKTGRRASMMSGTRRVILEIAGELPPREKQ